MAVVFDLDGTLVDSWQVHRTCLRRACTAVGAGRPSAAGLAQAQRATDLATLAELVGESAAAGALDVYHEALSDELGRRLVTPVPTAATVLEELSTAGLRTGVCTGRSRPGAEALLASAGLTIPVLVAREDAVRPKPAPDGLRQALRSLGADPAAALYVGDTEDDRRQGRAAGVRTIVIGHAVPDLADLISGMGQC
jgi:HAD superfamily hydrolase (TIGR01509 family)